MATVVRPVSSATVISVPGAAAVASPSCYGQGRGLAGLVPLGLLEHSLLPKPPPAAAGSSPRHLPLLGLVISRHHSSFSPVGTDPTSDTNVATGGVKASLGIHQTMGDGGHRQGDRESSVEVNDLDRTHSKGTEEVFRGGYVS